MLERRKVCWADLLPVAVPGGPPGTAAEVRAAVPGGPPGTAAEDSDASVAGTVASYL